jgi:hypothetical protein
MTDEMNIFTTQICLLCCVVESTFLTKASPLMEKIPAGSRQNIYIYISLMPSLMALWSVFHSLAFETSVSLSNSFSVSEKSDPVMHVARIGEKRNAYKLLVGKPEGRRALGRPRRRWVNNIRMDLGEVGWGDVDWIGLPQDRDRWRALVNSVLNLRVP